MLSVSLMPPMQPVPSHAAHAGHAARAKSVGGPSAGAGGVGAGAAGAGAAGAVNGACYCSYTLGPARGKVSLAIRKASRCKINFSQFQN